MALFQDLKYAYRQLSRTPGFTFAAVFALALGIGANVAIFSTINAVLLNSLPFRALQQPERLVSVYETNPALLAFIAGRLPVRMKNFLAWKKQAQSFTTLEAYQDTQFDVTSSGSNGHTEPEQVNAVTATAGLFHLFGIAPRLGRGFTNADLQFGRDHVAILSDDLWRSRFSADPNILGKTIRASGLVTRSSAFCLPVLSCPPAEKAWIKASPNSGSR